MTVAHKYPVGTRVKFVLPKHLEIEFKEYPPGVWLGNITELDSLENKPWYFVKFDIKTSDMPEHLVPESSLQPWKD